MQQDDLRSGQSLTEKKKVFRNQFSQKSPRALHVLNHGWWRLAVGGWRLVAVGGWRLAVGGPLGRSLRAVLSRKKKSGPLRTALPPVDE